MNFYGQFTTRTTAQLVKHLDIETNGNVETVELPNLIHHRDMVDAYIDFPKDGKQRKYKCLDCGAIYNEIPQGCEQCPAVFLPF